MEIREGGILDNVLKLGTLISERGRIVRSTKELTNIHLGIRNVDYGSSYEEAFLFYTEGELWDDFSSIRSEERLNYTALMYGLLQKIEFNRFYFKEEPIISRKLIVHSEDCISTLQILAREYEPKEGTSMYTRSLEIGVYMRSSDVIHLLHSDLLGVVNICESVRDKLSFDFNNVKIDINVLIGSAHIYMKGNPRGLDDRFSDFMKGEYKNDRSKG